MVQTLREVTDPRYAFDKIYCFEPAPLCWPQICALVDERVELCRFGLWNQTCRRNLYGAGELFASIFEDFESLDPRSPVASIELVHAREWMAAHTQPGDVIFAKLNCEGAECDIVEDLLDAQLLPRIYSLMIDFDIRKVPSLRWRERVVRHRLREHRLMNVCFSDDVMVGPSHQARIRHWLIRVGAEQRLPLAELRRQYAPTLAKLASQRGLAKSVWRTAFPANDRRVP
jgi:hypothetical protein